MPRSITEGFDDFLTKLKSTASESDAAKQHRASIEACLKNNFGLKRFARIGSFGNGTSVSGYLGCAGAFVGLAIEDRLQGIKARTLYISGAEDTRGGPPALMAGLAAKIPGARHISVPNAAHIANIQNPAAFNRVLADFLREK